VAIVRRFVILALFTIFRNLLILVTLAILTGFRPFWKSLAILANFGYLPILITFANFSKWYILSHFGKVSPFDMLTVWRFYGKLLILIILATLPLLAILNGFGNID